jgi:transcriptional regulator with XRE-family HTH domain
MQVHRFALKDFMEGEGLRLTDLAAKSGVSMSFLSQLLSGAKTEASPATLRKLADALGIRVRSLAANPDAITDADAEAAA